MWNKHQNLLSNTHDAPSVTRYGSLVRLDTQMVALRSHCAKCVPSVHQRHGSSGWHSVMSVSLALLTPRWGFNLAAKKEEDVLFALPVKLDASSKLLTVGLDASV